MAEDPKNSSSASFVPPSFTATTEVKDPVTGEVKPADAVVDEPLPKTAEEKSALLAKADAEKAEKMQKVADLQVQLESKRVEYRSEVQKSEADKAKFAAKEDAKLAVYRDDIAKLEGEITKLVEEAKVEPRYIQILREYGGLESNVPLTSEYWRLRP